MLATGGFLISVALLTLAAVAPVFRSSNPPRWATRGWIGELVTLAIVCMLALGVGYLGAGAVGMAQTGADYLDLSLLALVLVVAVVIWRQLSARTRPGMLKAEAPARYHAPESGQAHGGGPMTAAEPLPVSASEPPPPTKAA